MQSANIEITQEEARIVRKFLTETPITGSLQTLPHLLGVMASVISKMERAFSEPDPQQETPHDSPQPPATE